MAGTYRQLKNGKWELCVHLEYNELTGKRIRKYKYVAASSEREVKKLLALFVSECSKLSKYNSYGNNLTVEDFSKLWVRDYVEKHLKKKTISDYKDILERIIYCLGHKKLTELKPSHLIQFYNLLSEDGIRKDGKAGGLSPKTIKHYHLVISSMLNSAFQWELIDENISKRVSPPKIPKKEIKTLSIDQAKEMIKALNKEPEKYRLLVIIAIFTGFRRGEILGLQWSDVDSNENSITVKRTSSYTNRYGIFEDTTKTSSSTRTSYVPDAIIKMLEIYKNQWILQKENCQDRWKDTDRIFVQWDGAPLHPDTITKWFRKFVKRHNLPNIKFHGLRHAHGSILLALGLDPASVSEQLGHADLQMVFQVYGHNVRKNSKKVADLLGDAFLDTN